MAIGSLNLKVSKSDFERRITTIDLKMGALMDVINNYNSAKRNLDQFIEAGDDNYQLMIERIDTNVNAAKKYYTALGKIKVELQNTVTEMDQMSSKVKETISSATQAAASTISAAIKIDSIL